MANTGDREKAAKALAEQFRRTQAAMCLRVAANDPTVTQLPTIDELLEAEEATHGTR